MIKVTVLVIFFLIFYVVKLFDMEGYSESTECEAESESV